MTEEILPQARSRRTAKSPPGPLLVWPRTTLPMVPAVGAGWWGLYVSETGGPHYGGEHVTIVLDTPGRCRAGRAIADSRSATPVAG